MASAPQSQGSSGILTALQNGVSAINGLAAILKNIWPRTTGTFTLAASASTTVAQPAIQSNSVVQLTPTNAAAATLQGSAKALYVSAIVAGASFTVSTASSTAAGTETFSYAIFSPS